jgi:hypothetical protein
VREERVMDREIPAEDRKETEKGKEKEKER